MHVGTCYNLGQENAPALLLTAESMAELITGLKENESDMEQPTTNLSTLSSEEIKRQIWQAQLRPTEKLVLLAMADFVVESEIQIDCGLHRIAYLTGLSHRTTYGIARNLKRKGVLIHLGRTGMGKGGWERGSRYLVNLAATKSLPPFCGANTLLSDEREVLLSWLVPKHDAMCVYCSGQGNGRCGPDGEVWHVDRIVPGSEGGRYTSDNVALSCAICNRKKGRRLL